MTKARKGGEPPLSHLEEFFIDGRWTQPSTDKRIDVVAPANEELYMRVAEATEEDMNRAVAAARRAFDEGPWPRMTHQERAVFLMKIADRLIERADDIAQIWPNEMGIVHSLASEYAKGVNGIYRYYAGLASKFPFVEERRTFSGAKNGFLVREPVGVVGAIIPWNGPISLIAFKLAPALLAGCTTVIKASPEAPGHILLMGEIAEEVGLPPGVVNVLTANREASESLVRNPGVDKIAFTGSSAAGRRIASVLGERIGRCTLELGGKSAAIILDDYDVSVAADAITAQACPMSGQVCASLTRVIVSKHRQSEFVEALSDRFSKIRVGDPFDKDTQMGPLATRTQRERVERYIALGREAGFKLTTGGARPPGLNRGFYIEPTVFADVENSSAIAQEEIFGPVVSVIPCASEKEAVRMANDSIFGLNGAVFTNDVERAYAIGREIRSGTFGQNACRMDFTIAFGGFKQSGIGREGGVEGLLPYLESKTMLLEGKPAALTES